MYSRRRSGFTCSWKQTRSIRSSCRVGRLDSSHRSRRCESVLLKRYSPACGEGRTAAMSISVRDVAERAGVSVGTVSNVLNNPDKVASATSERVLAAIEDLGFVRNDAARQLRAGHSRSIGMIVLDVRNPFFTDVARGAESTAADAHLSVLLANSDERSDREAAYLDLFEEQRVRGILITPVGDVLPRLEQLRSRGIPCVLVARLARTKGFSSVSVDDESGGAIALTHLAETGRRHVAYVGG